MKKISFFLSLVAVGCAGCVHARKAEAVIAPPMKIASEVPVVSGTDLDQTNVEKIRVTENLKAYPVGRYIDGGDPNVMHEAHVIYRKESDASWNLNPNAPTVVPLGPVLALADPARTPAPLPAELEHTMAEQNQLVASLIEQNEALTKELGFLGKQIAELRQNQRGAQKEKSP